MNTCVSMNCPFIFCCKEYNFLVDRGSGCNIQNKIVRASENFKKEIKKSKRT
jgi:hypothetical protein